MPHILFILVDALRADQFSCYTGRDMGTPNIDELAHQGIVFTNAISQAPCTRPSVPSFMTGLYPSQHGVVDAIKGAKKGLTSAAALDPGIPTLAETLAADGYNTAAFLAGNANLKPVFGLTRGFSHVQWRPTRDGAVVAEDFAEWLENQQPERSFCYVHLMDVHNPLPVETIPSRLDRGLDLNLVQETMVDLIGYYEAAVRLVDRHVGRMVRALEAAGILEDTWIIITADHGEELMEHGAMLAHGRHLYRELVHVPLVMKMPGRAYDGRRITEPVQLIDLMPTIHDYVRLPSSNRLGRSLLALIQGEEIDKPSAAFSELFRRDRYIQSVTTTTHQLILSYILEEFSAVSSQDLKPGLSVEIKGQPIRNGPFLATKVSLQDKETSKLRGTVEQVDPKSGAVTTMGLNIHFAEDTKFKGLNNEPFGPKHLTVGSKISITFVASNGQLVATKINQRKSGGKSKIEGRIERVQELGDGLRSITVLGKEISINKDVRIPPVREKKRAIEGKTNAFFRVLTGNYLDTKRELYDITSDPAESRNIVNERPDIAQELEEILAGWTQTLVSGIRPSAGSVDIDPETLEQLRLMGYVD